VVRMSLIRNDKVHLDYEFLETMEAGLELFGTEVKTLRAGRGSLKGARIIARGGECYLVGASIPAWQIANAGDFDPERPRRLLLNQKEIARVASAEGAQGLTIVPISVYSKGRQLKLEIAVARGKKKADKRHDLKKRDTARSIERMLKQHK
jgi:SsrA-binding protein